MTEKSSLDRAMTRSIEIRHCLLIEQWFDESEWRSMRSGTYTRMRECELIQIEGQLEEDVRTTDFPSVDRNEQFCGAQSFQSINRINNNKEDLIPPLFCFIIILNTFSHLFI
jgi:hypothetical protein